MKALTLKQKAIMEWKEHFRADHLPSERNVRYVFKSVQEEP